MTLNEAIMQLVEIWNHPMCPVIFKPALNKVIETISELEEQQAKQTKEYADQLKKAQQILNSIASRTLRTFVMMKYMFETPDTEIRRELNMTRRSFDQARKCVEDAPDMASVRWQEKYVVAKKGYAGKKH